MKRLAVWWSNTAAGMVHDTRRKLRVAQNWNDELRRKNDFLKLQNGRLNDRVGELSRLVEGRPAGASASSQTERGPA